MCCRWELVATAQKLILVGFFVLEPFNPGSFSQLVLGATVALLFAIAQIQVQPYKHQNDNLLATVSNLSLVSFYKLHHRDPFFFNDGFKFQWRNGDITDPKTGEKCIVMDGQPIGTPSNVNVTTLTYAYTWE